jgi:hypothetical protein
MKKIIGSSLVIVGILLATVVMAAQPGRGQVWLDGQLANVIAPPAHVAAGSGTDPLYQVPNQMAVAAYGPGHPAYRGGRWAVYMVAWNDGHSPHELHSYQDVMDAQNAGEITVTRNPGADNLCPIHQGQGERD